MFGSKKDKTPSKAGMITEILGLINNGSEMDLLKFAKRPILDFFEFLRKREHGNVWEIDGQKVEFTAIDVIVYRTDSEGNPKTEILTGKLNEQGIPEYTSRAELNGLIIEMIKKG
jgi:hypothetical protein